MGLFKDKFENFFNKSKTEPAETTEPIEPKRTKEQAQQELIEKFGMRKTSDFQLALQEGKVELAEEWLKYIVEHKMSFPQYLATWDNWLNDRQRELMEKK